MGLRVGLLDADVYGPSLPILLPELSSVVQRSPTNPKNVLPLRAAHCPDLKMLSFGHVNPKSGAPGSVYCSVFANIISIVVYMLCCASAVLFALREGKLQPWSAVPLRLAF